MMLNPGAGCGCCGGCDTKVCVTTLCGAVTPVAGAVVTALSDSVPVASAVTGTDGCATLTVPEAGTYEVTVAIAGVVVHDADAILACGGTLPIQVFPGAGLVCCGSFAVPAVLMGTDSRGSFPVALSSLPFANPTWVGCHAVTLDSACTISIAEPGDVCTVSAPATRTVIVCYFLSCNSAFPGGFKLERRIPWTSILGIGDSYYYSMSGPPDCTEASPTFLCPGTAGGAPPYEHCPPNGNDPWDAYASAATNAPFTVAFPAPAYAVLGTPHVPDLGGGVVFSQ